MHLTKTLLRFFIIFPLFVNSQVTIDSINGVIYLDQVHEVELGKSALKKKAFEWVAKSFNNSNYVTRINNEDQILAKGMFEVGADYSNYGVTVYSPRKIDYTLDLKFREGRYRIEVADISPSASGIQEPFMYYFVGFEEYRALQKKLLESLDMPGTKAALNRLNNDKKARKDYDALKDYYNEILPQIISEIEKIDTSLFTYMKSNSEDDDW